MLAQPAGQRVAVLVGQPDIEQRQIGPRIRANAVYNFNDIVSMQRGKHFLKIGADFVQRGFTFEQARNARGTFRFDGTYTGSSLAAPRSQPVHSRSLSISQR